MEIVFRKLQPADAPEFRRVRLECLKNFPDNFGTLFEDEIVKPKLFFEEQIERAAPDVFFYGAFAGGKLAGIAGFVRGDRTKTRHRGEIVSMYVDPDFHGQKVGERLLRALIEAAFAMNGIERISLTVVAENRAAVSLYERVGFETFGVQKDYFKAGDRYWNQRFMALAKESFVKE